MKIQLVLALIVGLVTLVGCQSNPVSTSHTNNTSIGVDFLFEHEGCRVYRFTDGNMGQTVYYANCGAHAQTAWQHSCGRDCIKRETVSTSQPGE
jgi:hypothetical protein